MSNEQQRNVMEILGATDDHLQAAMHYGHSHDLREAMATVQELVDALQRLVGTPGDPNNGWRGNGSRELFACEYCGRQHGDFVALEHSPTCPVPFARAALAKATHTATQPA